MIGVGIALYIIGELLVPNLFPFAEYELYEKPSTWYTVIILAHARNKVRAHYGIPHGGCCDSRWVVHFAFGLVGHSVHSVAAEWALLLDYRSPHPHPYPQTLALTFSQERIVRRKRFLRRRLQLVLLHPLHSSPDQRAGVETAGANRQV